MEEDMEEDMEELLPPLGIGPEEGGPSRVLESPMVRSFARSAASALGREVTRSLSGTGRRR